MESGTRPRAGQRQTSRQEGRNGGCGQTCDGVTEAGCRLERQLSEARTWRGTAAGRYCPSESPWQPQKGRSCEAYSAVCVAAVGLRGQGPVKGNVAGPSWPGVPAVGLGVTACDPHCQLAAWLALGKRLPAPNPWAAACGGGGRGGQRGACPGEGDHPASVGKYAG